MSGAGRTATGVALCARLDLVARFGPAFAALAPEVSLLRPEDVQVPGDIEFALCWAPADDAFLPYANLRAVFSIAAGIDGILACPSLPDVPVIRVEDPDQAAQMAGFAAFQVVWHHRDMRGLLDAQARAEWGRPEAGRSPARIRIGVMGFGHMGRAVGRGLVALGYPVASLSRRRPDPPEPGVTHLTDRAAFLAAADILVNVLPMTEETRGLFDDALFAALPAGAAFVHLGRGAQLDEAALLRALETGRLSGASLDVFATEPLPPDHPFWRHPRILVTPHTASEAEPPAVVASVRAGLARLRGRSGARA